MRGRKVRDLAGRDGVGRGLPRAESRSGTIGPITPEKKSTGKPGVGKRHAGFDVAGVGTVIRGAGLRPIAKAVESSPDPLPLARQLSTGAEYRLLSRFRRDRGTQPRRRFRHRALQRGPCPVRVLRSHAGDPRGLLPGFPKDSAMSVMSFRFNLKTPESARTACLPDAIVPGIERCLIH